MRTILQSLAVIAILALCACSSAAPPAGAPAEPVAALPATPAPERELPPAGGPVPANGEKSRATPEFDAEGAKDAKDAEGAGSVDYSCSTDADCAVKDVGNCCGYYPACVNVDSPTFPERVKAQCAEQGMSSVCGFPAIESCVCKAGRCEAGPAATLVE